MPRREIIELPEGFQPAKINKAGAVAGTTSSGGVAIYDGGPLTPVPVSGFGVIADFNDAGEILWRKTHSNRPYDLEVVRASGARVLARPIVDGDARIRWNGWGPDTDGRVIGTISWSNPGKGFAYLRAEAASLLHC